MNKDSARKIADALTWSRVVSVVPITVLAWYELKWWVLALYIAASLTDLFDGIFARRAAPPVTDTDFDGLADVLLSVMTLLWLWMVVQGFFQKYGFLYFPLLALLEIYVTYVRIRYPELTIPHLEFGRYAMALFFSLLPVLIIWGDVSWFVHSVLIISTAGLAQLSWTIHRSCSRANTA